MNRVNALFVDGRTNERDGMKGGRVVNTDRRPQRACLPVCVRACVCSSACLLACVCWCVAPAMPWERTYRLAYALHPFDLLTPEGRKNGRGTACKRERAASSCNTVDAAVAVRWQSSRPRLGRPSAPAVTTPRGRSIAYLSANAVAHCCCVGGDAGYYRTGHVDRST